jgi:hypothetical protein
MILFLLSASPCALAQGTSQQNNIRGGYVGPSSPSATSQSPANTPSLGSPSRNSTGTGQGRTEGAYGLTPQLQKELGIGRQQ